MSRIEEMIRELCPNGVEYKALGEIGTFVRGNGLILRMKESVVFIMDKSLQ